MLQLGESYSVLGELQQGKNYLYEAINSSIKAADYSVATVAYFRLGNVLKIQGKLREAEKMFQQNLLALRELGGHTSPLLGKPEIGLGDVFREQGQLDTARELLSTGHTHSQLQGQPSDLVYSYIYRARLFEAQGRREQALELLSQAEPLFVSYTNPPAVRLAFECYRVNVWLRLGKLGEAADWVAENRLDCHTDINYTTEQKLISLARLLIAQGRLNEVQDLLSRLAASADAGGRIGRLIEILVLHALASQAAGHIHLACEVLLKSVQLAKPESYLRIFLDEGKSMIELLRVLKGAGLDSQTQDYIDHLLNACTEDQN